VIVAVLLVAGCGGGERAAMTDDERAAAERAIAQVIDDWHDAAARFDRRDGV
jgi:hypothetical protein